MEESEIEKCPLLRVLLFIIVGIYLADYLGRGVSTEVWMLIVLVCSVGFVVLSFCRKLQLAQSLLIFLLAFSVAGWRMCLQQNQLFSTKYDQLDYCQAIVAQEPSIHGKVVRTKLLVLDGQNVGQTFNISILRDRLLEKWRRIHEGDGVIVHALLYDGAFIYKDNWIKASVSLSAVSGLMRLRVYALKLRHKLLLHISNHDYSPSFAIIAAMTLGDKSYLSKEQKNDFSAAGSSHLLALSGLHLSILIGVLLLLFPKNRWQSQLFILLAIWAFVILVGMSASVVRSAIMLSLCMLMHIADRKGFSLNSLSFAAILMLLCNPQSLFDVGFQMSCMAVMGIILLTPNIHNKVGSILLVSLSAQIATLPLTLYYFGQWSCYGIFLSLLVIPLSTIILYGMLGVYLLLPFSASAQKLYIVVEEMVEILNQVVSSVASLPGAMISHVYISKFQVFLLYVAILSFYMAIKKFVLIKK